MSRPYEWHWKTVGRNLMSYWDDARTVCRNIKRFWPVLLRFKTFDYYGLVLFIEIATREMAAHHRKHRVVTTWERTAQQLATVSQLCHRINEDEYMDMAGYNWDTWKDISAYERHQICQHATYMQKQDAVYLGRMFRYINHWWD